MLAGLRNDVQQVARVSQTFGQATTHRKRMLGLRSLCCCRIRISDSQSKLVRLYRVHVPKILKLMDIKDKLQPQQRHPECRPVRAASYLIGLRYHYMIPEDPGPRCRAALEWILEALGNDPRMDEDSRRLKALEGGPGGTMQAASDKIKVLFLCTGNSCRSQMAEGWTRRLKSDAIEPYSAGIETHGLNPLAVKVMAEIGVDISGHRSKHLDEVLDIPFDYVVTVCDNANESCPVFPGRVGRLHVSFDDPPRLARNAKSDEEALGHYRRVRDEIRAFVETLPEALTQGT